MMCRGENLRTARLSDISAHIFRRNSYDNYRSLGITLSMLQGKMNREGKVNFGVVVRNKDVELYPVGALAFYLLELWMVCYVSCPRYFYLWPDSYRSVSSCIRSTVLLCTGPRECSI